MHGGNHCPIQNCPAEFVIDRNGEAKERKIRVTNPYKPTLCASCKGLGHDLCKERMWVDKSSDVSKSKWGREEDILVMGSDINGKDSHDTREEPRRVNR